MPRESPYVIKLSAEERRILEARVRQYTLPYRDVVRAKIVLLSAKGLQNKEIGERLDTPRPVVSKWRAAALPLQPAGTQTPCLVGRDRG